MKYLGLTPGRKGLGLVVTVIIIAIIIFLKLRPDSWVGGEGRLEMELHLLQALGPESRRGVGQREAEEKKEELAK